MEKKIVISIYGRTELNIENEEDFVGETDLLKKRIEKQLEKIGVLLGEIEVEEVN